MFRSWNSTRFVGTLKNAVVNHGSPLMRILELLKRRPPADDVHRWLSASTIRLIVKVSADLTQKLADFF
jgi:hypothetical protein